MSDGVEILRTHKTKSGEKSQVVVKVRAAGNEWSLGRELQRETKASTIPFPGKKQWSAEEGVCWGRERPRHPRLQRHQPGNTHPIPTSTLVKKCGKPSFLSSDFFHSKVKSVTPSSPNASAKAKESEGAS